MRQFAFRNIQLQRKGQWIAEGKGVGRSTQAAMLAGKLRRSCLHSFSSSRGRYSLGLLFEGVKKDVEEPIACVWY